jgi:pimeloyl-ACP methyl ester carboxylesterase
MRALLPLSLLALSGCTVGRFMDISMQSGREPIALAPVLEREASCVLVMLPGIGDSPQRFDEHGFVSLVREDPSGCDVTVADTHFGYYRDANIVPRLAEVLQPLRARYAQVWLVGISLGGYGAALTARDRPDLVDGVVLISPFLGLPNTVRPLIERVEREGGLKAFEAGPARPLANARKHFMEVEPLWGWLAERARDESGQGPRVLVAWGEDDRLAPTLRVVGRAFDDSFSTRGGHDWVTFAGLFRQVVATAPWRG